MSDEPTVVSMIHEQLQDLDGKVDNVLSKSEAAAIAAKAAKGVAESTLAQAKLTNGRVTALERRMDFMRGVGIGLTVFFAASGLIALAVDLIDRFTT